MVISRERLPWDRATGGGREATLRTLLSTCVCVFLNILPAGSILRECAEGFSVVRLQSAGTFRDYQCAKLYATRRVHVQDERYF